MYVNGVMQTEIHTAQPSAFVVGMAIEKLKDTNHQVLIKFHYN